MAWATINYNLHCRASLKWSSMVRMRPVPAMLLVFLFGFSLIGPACFVDADSNLPACCRRDGKHCCGIMAQDMAATPSSGLAIASLRARCPLFPNSGAVVPHSGAALLRTSRPAGAANVGQIVTLAQAEAGTAFRSTVPIRSADLLVSSPNQIVVKFCTGREAVSPS